MAFQLEPLPRIACFHGGGSAGAIYEVQCEQLIDQFASTFEFVFFNAPFYRDAGPGVLPFFKAEKWGPYRQWFSKDEEGNERSDGRAEDGQGEGGIERVLGLLAAAGEGGEWVGCMGFSQGTRIVGGLLLDQQRRKEMGIKKAEGDIDFKFGVLCMGSSAPMMSDISNMAEDEGIITTPTLHLHGLKDFVYARSGEQLKTWFDPSTARLLEINYHHAMPWHRADVLKFSEEFRKIYKDSVKRKA